ncbi:response regulator [Aquisalimonas asiatica]|uniref:Response regulator receiver domain-containing protein n=1 Tax=Aquisalimonas asiatica TaxID=406100 RepID=A0A1H8UCD7_9GAMM|nr:response regulator [Aquisalimonas asiatica]SEP00298.1 Response regulator receiver domain-containing protein [Aquisalimonas asiatica]
MASDRIEPVSIVVVDDAKFTLEMLRRVLETTGYTDIRIARSAAEALAMLGERQADILLADWLMPEMDGLGLTREVRAQDAGSGHRTSIILLSGKEEAGALTEAYASGVDHFVTKSPDSEALLEAVRVAVDRIGGSPK